jgi:hypothetical protein
LKHDQERDQALLLLAVGELSGFGKFTTELHLLVCRECQARLETLKSASDKIAASIQGARAPQSAPLSLSHIKRKFVTYTVALAVLAGAAIAGVVEYEHSLPCPPKVIVRHCLPGIVSDQCR